MIRAGSESGLLATDLYQLTMLDAYRQSGMTGRATFEFFFRRLPPTRGFLMAAGLADLLERLEGARFSGQELDWLRRSGRFPDDTIDWLADWRFTGDVDAVPEGTLVFAEQPVVRVDAPIVQAQLIETLVISQLHFQTLIASKTARMVLAAPDKLLIDFGLRRAHSLESGLYAARAAWLAGFAGTATALAGMRYGIPVHGTMAHSFVQAHDSEEQAFRHFAQARPSDTTLLIDTYDTEVAARIVVGMAGWLRERGIRVRGVRIDSGDLEAHARQVRRILDDGGLSEVRIVASGGLDEWKLGALVAAGAPIDSFGVGTSLTTSEDDPALDCGYKLVSYAGKPRRKRSEGKTLWPGAKQVFRRFGGNGRLVGDVLGLADEDIDGEALLRPVMRNGLRLPQPDLAASRERAAQSLAQLPDALRALDGPYAYSVEVSQGLQRLAAELAAQGH